MRLVVYLCLIRLFLNPSFAFSGGSPNFTFPKAGKVIYSGVPIPSKLSLYPHLCSIAFGEKPPRVSEPVEFRLIEETFNPDQKSWEAGPILGIARNLHISRMNYGERVASSIEHPDWTAYSKASSLTFASRVEGQEYRVRLIRPQSLTHTSDPQNGLAMSYMPIVWSKDSTFRVDRTLLTAKETDKHVYALNDRSHAERVIPKEVLSKMDSYDLYAASMGYPHDESAPHLSQLHLAEVDLRIPLPEYFVVMDRSSRVRIGYLLVQDLLWNDTAGNKDAMYRNHFGPGSTVTTTSNKTVRRLRAHFDLESHRVELWHDEEDGARRGELISHEVNRRTLNVFPDDSLGHTVEPTQSLPVGRNRTRLQGRIPTETRDLTPLHLAAIDSEIQLIELVERSLKDLLSESSETINRTFAPSGKYVFLSQGNQHLLVSTASMKVVRKYRFEGFGKISLVKFSKNGQDIIFVDEKGRFRIYDAETGQKKVLFTGGHSAGSFGSSVTQWLEVAENLYLLGLSAASPGQVVLFNALTYEETPVALKSHEKLFGLSRDHLYLFHSYFGVRSKPFYFDQNRRALQYGDWSKETSHWYSRATNFTNYRVLSPSGDIFSARNTVSEDRQAHYDALFQLRENSLTEVMRLDQKGGDSQLLVSDLNSNNLRSVATVKDGEVEVLFLNSQGTRIQNRTNRPEWSSQENDIRLATLSRDGSHLAVLNSQGLVSVWNLFTRRLEKTFETKLSLGSKIHFLDSSLTVVVEGEE